MHAVWNRIPIGIQEDCHIRPRARIISLTGRVMADMDQGQSKIAVLILDDQLIQREGVARVVEVTGTMRVAGAVGTAEEAFELLRAAPIDLALVDLVLRGSRGIDVGRAMRRLRPALKVIIYTREKSMVVAAEILRERKDLPSPGCKGTS